MPRRQAPEHEDGLIELLGAVARQAIADAQSGYHGKGMEARQWLMLAGLMSPDGQIPRHNPATFPPSKRAR